MSIHPNGQVPLFGTDPGIQLQSPTEIKIRISGLCACCGPEPTRRYFYVVENAYEQNDPFAASCLGCIRIPPNCCCPGVDFIQKHHFDRGIFDQQNCCWSMGCLKGAPSTYANQVKYVCLCQDCCECYNNFAACYFPNICGDRVRVNMSETFCCCCSNRACWMHNCCGLCGPKDGEPLALAPFLDCLQEGSAPGIQAAFDTTRAAWCQRTGKK